MAARFDLVLEGIFYAKNAMEYRASSYGHVKEWGWSRKSEFRVLPPIPTLSSTKSVEERGNRRIENRFDWSLFIQIISAQRIS